jgi:2-polyprenyl-3-methyl-5-hydroxy-6-metoxy-1,4-benzoquinol methylase
MSNLIIYIDNLNNAEIAGWIDDDGPVPAIEIEIDGRWVCSLSPAVYRPDVEKGGIGDGRRGFVFPLAGRLGPDSVVTVKRHGTVLYQDCIADAANPEALPEAQAHARSQRRWRADEPAQHLTWGRLMTGDSLWDLYQRWYDFTSRDQILEIGPGYGRVLKTAIARGVPFASYTAVELSQARVDRLSAEFPTEGVRFVQGDVDSWAGDKSFDVVICSSTFEHLHPDCRRALRNIHRQLSPGGLVFIDFIETVASSQDFETTGVYIRQYCKEELSTIFSECGYALQAVETCTLGEGNFGPVNRYVVAAKRGNAAQ